MKSLALITAGAVGLLTLSVGASALAATPGAAAPSAWSDAPDLYRVAGESVDGGAVATHDFTPRLEVDTLDRAHVGDGLVVREAVTGQMICNGDEPVSESLFAACTASKLDVGTTSVEAVFVSPTGEETEPARVELTVMPQRLEIDVTGYDSLADVVGLSGNGVPGATVAVGQYSGAEDEFVSVDAEVSESGSWSIDYPEPLDTDFEVEHHYAGKVQWAKAAFIRNAPPKPLVEQRTEGSDLVLDVRAPEGDRIEVQVWDRGVIASTARTGDLTTLRLRAPTAEAQFGVSVVRDGAASVANWFLVNEGVGERRPGAPDVDEVARSGERAIVSVSAQPGSVVRIVTADDRILATRLTPASGKVSLVVPAPVSAKAEDELFVSQTSNGRTSPRDDFRIPVGG